MPEIEVVRSSSGGLPATGSNGQGLLVRSDGTVAYVDEVIYASAWGVVGDNSTDNTAALTAALLAAVTPVSPLTGFYPKKTVQLPVGYIRCQGPLSIKANQILRGMGANSTYLVCTNASTVGPFIQNETQAFQVQIEDLGIQYSGTAATGSTAINLTTPATSPLGDAKNIIRNVQIVAPYVGITDAGTTEARYDNVTVQRSLSDGIVRNGASDGFITRCTVGQPGRHGITSGPNDRIVACKVFGGGNGSSYAFNLQGGGRVELAACEAQDHNGGGFTIPGDALLSSCLADSVANTAFFFQAGGNSSTVVSSKAVVRGGGAYTTALGIDAENVGNLHIDILTTGCTERVRFSGSNSFSSYVNIDSCRSLQAVAYAASIKITPYLGGTHVISTITGNLAITSDAVSGNPTPWYADQEVSLLLVVDSTGGYTLSFDSHFALNGTAPALNANGVTRITFRADTLNGKWRETGRTDMTNLLPASVVKSVTQALSISGTPTAGQVLTATSSTAADWATPAGASSGGGLMAQPVVYAPTTPVTYTVANGSGLVALDTTNLRITFTTATSGPGSTSVVVRLQAGVNGAARCYWGLAGTGAPTTGYQVVGSQSNAILESLEMLVTGLTANTTYTWDFAAYSSAASTSTVIAGAAASGAITTSAYPASIKVSAGAV